MSQSYCFSSGSLQVLEKDVWCDISQHGGGKGRGSSAILSQETVDFWVWGGVEGDSLT